MFKRGTFVQRANPPRRATAKEQAQDADVLQIRAAFKGGEAQTALALRFNVSPGTIAYIVHNRTWKHLLPKE